MKLTKTAEIVLKKRYLLKDDEGNIIETPEQMLWRVANAIAKAEELYGGNPDEIAKKFFKIMDEQLFLPNSPTLMNAGTELNQLSACFVIPIEDSIDGIFKALWDMAKVQKSGGGCINGDSLIFIEHEDGGREILKIRELFERVTAGKKLKEFGNGKYVEVDGLYTYAFDPTSCEFKKAKITRVWIFDVPKFAKYKVRVGNIGIQTSDWHPFFVLTKDFKLVTKRADELEVGDLVIRADLSDIFASDGGLLLLHESELKLSYDAFIELLRPIIIGKISNGSETKIVLKDGSIIGLGQWKIKGRISRFEVLNVLRKAEKLAENELKEKLAKVRRLIELVEEVKEIVKIYSDEPFYDLSVEYYENYLAGTKNGFIVVHNTGFSFSRLRPKGDIVRSTKGVASGPVSFMKIFDCATEQIKQGGKRRGANMGVLSVHHPDIEEFIKAKWEEGVLRNFNISVAITDKFMEALKNNGEIELINPRTGKVVRKVPAKKIFDLIVEGAWRNGEPGMIFIDTINKYNPTPHVGKIEATNPCGELPLLPYESCNLGSINVSKFVKGKDIDWDRLREVVWLAVRFLDNVIDVNSYPIPEIEKMTKANRKIGLGVMGWADLLFKLRIPYDSEEALQLAEKLMSFIQSESHKASQALAEERGVFPNWKGSVWEKKGIKMRNATTTSIAPTGTISIIAGCSSGIEPVYALTYKRTHILNGEEFFEINPVFEETLKKMGLYSEELIAKIAEEGSIQGMKELPEEIRRVFKCALDIHWSWHVRMQAAFQKYVDNAVAKTVNLPNHATREDVAKVFLMAYELGCKGVTVYRDGSREEQVLVTKKIEKLKKYIEPRPRPKVTSGKTIRIRTGCGSLFVTINEDDYGLAEVFVHLGKSGSCFASQTEAIGRLISIALRSGVSPEAIIDQLKGIRCPAVGFDEGEMVTSCADGIAKALERYLRGDAKKVKPLTEFKEFKEIKEEKRRRLGTPCPECGNILEYSEGCEICRVCGYTRCG